MSNRTEMRRRHHGGLEVPRRVQRILSARLHKWGMDKIGVPAGEAIGRDHHLHGGNRRYQIWIIMGKHIRSDEGWGYVVEGSLFSDKRFCEEGHDWGRHRIKILCIYLPLEYRNIVC